MTIAWLPGAVLDLQRLREFLLPLNPEAANKAVTAIKAAVNLPTPHHYGRPVEDLAGYYDVIIPFGSAGYVLRYRVEGDVIYIIALKHTKEAGFSDHL